MKDWLEEVNRLKKEKPDARILFSVNEDDFNFYDHRCVVVEQSHVRAERLTIFNEKYVDKEELEEEILDIYDIFIDIDDEDLEKELSKIVDTYKFEDIIIVSVGC